MILKKKSKNEPNLIFKKMFRDYEKIGKFLIVVGILFTVFFGFEFIFNTNELTFGKIEPAIWGQFGDIVGGFVGTIVALIGVLLLFETLKQQRRANIKQQVETRFFELVKLHRDNVAEMQYQNVFGRNIFIEIKDEFHDLYEIVSVWYSLEKSEISEEIWEKKIIQISYLITFFGVKNSSTLYLKAKIKEIINNDVLFDEFNTNCIGFLVDKHQIAVDENATKPIDQKRFVAYDGYQSVLGHYFRHLYQTVTYINEQPETLLNYSEKYYYIKTLRAQLGTYEQAVFLYNSISTIGEPWELSANIVEVNDKLITKYNFIKNIPVGFTRDIIPKTYYPDIYYETDERQPVGRIELIKKFK